MYAQSGCQIIHNCQNPTHACEFVVFNLKQMDKDIIYYVNGTKGKNILLFFQSKGPYTREEQIQFKIE